MQQFNAFTSDYPEEASSLQTQCGVSAGVIAPAANHLPIKTVTAIWDTGAEISAISNRVATELGLTPVNIARNITAAGEISVYIYAVNIFLPNNVNFAMVPVTGNDLGDVDMLIGMDIISKGDFSITNVGGKTTFSFRIPSMERIDYVTAATPQPIVKAKEPGRNDPCPCGSGKKYKNCHGKV
ncbi:MAG: SEC-C domain-containing protein [Bacteroidales bacterium]|nr:SEC-C domain-containing protein [Bacteroidales bacterium]